jgi:hypothetical protein
MSSLAPPSPPGLLRRRLPLVLLASLILSSLLLSFVDLRDSPDDARFLQGGDSHEYLSLAENLDDGSGYLITEGGTFQGTTPTSYRTPGYPLAILALRQFVEADMLILAIVAYQNLLLAFLPLLFYSITLAATENRTCALSAAVLSLLFFPFRFLANAVLPDFLGLFLLLAALASLLSHLHRRSMAKLLAFSMLLGLAVIVKQNLVTALALLVFPLPRMLSRRQLLAAASLPLLLVSAWMVRNSSVHHAFPVFATNGGFNFFVGSHPGFHVDGRNITDFNHAMRDLMAEGLSEVEAERELYRRGWGNVRDAGAARSLWRVLSKLRVVLRDYFPPVTNEALFLLLPLALVSSRRRLLVPFVLAYHVFLLILDPSFELQAWTVYLGFNLDVTALHGLGLLGLALAVPGNRGFQLLASTYVLLLLPALIFIPLDRVTIVADAVLLVAYAAAPALLLKNGIGISPDGMSRPVS